MRARRRAPAPGLVLSRTHTHTHGSECLFLSQEGYKWCKKGGAGLGKRENTKGVRVAGHRSEGRGFIAVLRPLVTWAWAHRGPWEGHREKGCIVVTERSKSRAKQGERRQLYALQSPTGGLRRGRRRRKQSTTLILSVFFVWVGGSYNAASAYDHYFALYFDVFVCLWRVFVVNVMIWMFTVNS